MSTSDPRDPKRKNVRVDMQKFWWPGYEVQLVGELQRQQNSAQFCDTLLQTEGISVPTHSCVLAALSPYLCRRLSTSPSPPSGQKRRLQLQAVTPQTLLKLVGLLYSGELEVKGSSEQNDVMAAAHRFGIGHLVLGRKDEWVKGGELLCRRQSDGNHMSNGAEDTRQSHRGLKTQDAQVQADMNGRRGNSLPVKNKSFVSVGTQTVKAGVTSAFSSDPSDQTPECPSSVSLQPQSMTPSKRLSLSCPSVHSESSVALSPVSETSSSSSSTLSISLIGDLSSQQENISKQLFEARDGVFVPNDKKANGLTAGDGGTADEPLPEEERNSAEKSHSGGKSLEKMKQMEATKTSVKVKLRRRREEAWEVVTLQDKRRTLSVLASIKQGVSNPEMPQRDAQTSASVLPALNHETPNLRPVIAASPEPPQLSDVTLDHSSEQDLEVLREPQGSVEEPDEDIDRMLDEIMMGLNILPNLSDNCQRAQTSNDGAQDFCPVPDNGAESAHVPGAVSEAGCVFYQNLRIQSDHSSAEIECENSSCKTLATFCNSVAEDTSLYPQTGSMLPPTCVPPLSTQEDQTVLHFLRPSRENEPQSEHSFSSPCMNVSRLPRPLSPIEPHSPEAQQEPRPNKTSINPEYNVQPSLHRRPWLTEAPWSLHFPFLTLTEDKSRSLPQDSAAGCDSEQRCVGWTPNDRASCAEPGGGANEREKKSQPEEKFDPKMRKRKQPSTGDGATSKTRRCKGFLQDPLDRYLESKMPNFCSVSLSSNNVLARERKITATPSNEPCIEKMSQMATIDLSVEDKTRTAGKFSSEQMPIRTRSFLKKSQEKKSENVPKKPALTPSVCRTVVGDEQGIAVPKRKRGRPRKIKLDPPPLHDVPAKTETRSCDGTSEQQASSQPETRAGGRKRGRKPKGNTGEAEKNESAERSGKAEENDQKDLEMRKQSWMVTVKEFQKLMKRQTKKSTENQKTSEPAGAEEEERGAPNGSNSEVEITESVKIQDADENHSDLCNAAVAQGNTSQQDGSNSSTGQEKTSDQDHCSGDVLEVEVTETSSEKEQLLKNPDQGALCWTGGPDELQPATSNQTEPHCDAELPQITMKVLSPGTGPPLSGVNELSVTSCCDREEEEDGEEEEVDVLVFSPEKGPPVTACADGLSSIDIISDEEEDEDMDDIDVTG